MWVADWSDDKLYAYSMLTKERLPASDFTTLAAAGNTDPEGIWSDGTNMWVADWGDDKLYAYSMATKEYLPASDFVTLRATGNTAPTGIWSDGTNMWVADLDDDKLYAYDARGLINPSSLSSLLARVAEIAAAPDLVVSMHASRTNLAPSETITLTAMLRNTGGSSAAATTLRWYRSADSTIDTTDTQVSNTALSSLAAGG